MRKAVALISFVLMVGGVLFVTLQPAASQAPGGTTLTFFDPRKTDFEKEINEGRNGFSPGDWAVIKDSMYDPETCEKNGTFLGRFTFVKNQGENDGYFILDAGVILDDGKMTIYWPGRFTEFEAADSEGAGGAITGGTGAYEGQGGSVTTQEDVELCDKRGSLITVHLTP